MCHRAQARRRTAFEHNRYVGRPHLQDGAEFLVEQHRQGVGAERREIHVEAAMTGKCHLRERGKQPAVRPIVVRKQVAAGKRTLDDVKQRSQPRRIIQVRHFATDAIPGQGKSRPTEAVPASAQIDHQQLRRHIRAQDRRHTRPHIEHGREGRDNQRQRRGDDVVATG